MNVLIPTPVVPTLSARITLATTHVPVSRATLGTRLKA